MTLEELQLFLRRAQAAQTAIDELTTPAPDRSTPHTVELQHRLRRFLFAEMPLEPPDSIVAAMMYELASITAAMSDTEEQARALLGDLLANAEQQIKTFGVGKPHP